MEKKRKTGRDIRFPQGIRAIPKHRMQAVLYVIGNCDVFAVVFEKIVVKYN